MNNGLTLWLYIGHSAGADIGLIVEGGVKCTHVD